MNPNRWENLIFMAEEKFGIDKQYTEDFQIAELSTGEKIMGQREIVEFKSPLGQIRLEKTSRPKVVDKKVLHTKRIGGRITVDFVYSDKEKIVELKIYKNRASQNLVTRSARNKQDAGGEWEEISPESL